MNKKQKNYMNIKKSLLNKLLTYTLFRTFHK